MADMELVRAYLNRKSEEAFGILVSRPINLVYSTVLRRDLDPHLAQEVTQTDWNIDGRLGVRSSRSSQ